MWFVQWHLPSLQMDPTTEKARPWEGPLPKPRVSPKLSIGDAIEKAKIVWPSLSMVAASATRQGSYDRQSAPELG